MSSADPAEVLTHHNEALVLQNNESDKRASDKKAWPKGKHFLPGKYAANDKKRRILILNFEII